MKSYEAITLDTYLFGQPLERYKKNLDNVVRNGCCFGLVPVSHSNGTVLYHILVLDHSENL